MNKKRAIILIDGSNFYFKLKSLAIPHLLSSDFSGFNNHIAGNHKIVSTTYYIGAVKTGATTKTKRLHANQQRLFAHLKKHNVRYTLGYLLKSNNRFHEKGVDVHIAVDILIAAYENLCDRIVLVSSDTDLLPAVKKARDKKKHVEYVGFSHQPSLAMIANCTESRLLKKEDVLPFSTS